MRIAVTSQNFRTITGHAGKTRRFLIYHAQPGTEPVEVNRLDLPRELSFHEFSGGPHPVDGTDTLLTSSAGDGFMRKMAARGIRVVVTGETDPLQAVKDLLQGRVAPPLPHEHHHPQDRLNTSSDLTQITVLKLAENPQINDIAAQARTMLERVADRLGA